MNSFLVCVKCTPCVQGNRRSSEIQGTALGKCLQAWPVYNIYRSRPAGVAQSRRAFVQ